MEMLDSEFCKRLSRFVTFVLFVVGQHLSPDRTRSSRESASSAVPATRMKAKREHRVPLCGRAIKMLDGARALRDRRSGFVFTIENGEPLFEKQLRRLLRKHRIDAVPHGFRSSFRDWAAEPTNHPREVIEAALAHVVRNRVEAAYARSDLFERRRTLMDDRARYLAQGMGEGRDPRE